MKTSVKTLMALSLSIAGTSLLAQDGESATERPGNGQPPEQAQVGRPALPDEIRTIQEERRALQQELVASREALLQDLTESEATAEEIAEALEAWRTEHVEDFNNLQNLRESVREYVHENRPRREDRPGPSEAVKERRRAFQEQAEEIRTGREKLGEAMAKAETAEARRAIVEAFREEHRERMEEAKELRRAERRGDTDSGGDRRPGD